MRRRGPALAFAALAVAVGMAGAASAGETTTANARCLVGQWRTTNVEANRVLQRLAPNPNMKVSRGVLTAGFGSGELRYGSSFFSLALQAPPVTLRATATFVFEATYRVRGNMILLGPGSSEVTISKFKAVRDGKTVTVAGPEPQTTSTPAGAVPFTCSGNTLRIRPPVGATPASRVTFQRVR